MVWLLELGKVTVKVSGLKNNILQGGDNLPHFAWGWYIYTSSKYSGDMLVSIIDFEWNVQVSLCLADSSARTTTTAGWSCAIKLVTDLNKPPAGSNAKKNGTAIKDVASTYGLRNSNFYVHSRRCIDNLQKKKNSDYALLWLEGVYRVTAGWNKPKSYA